MIQGVRLTSSIPPMEQTGEASIPTGILRTTASRITAQASPNSRRRSTATEVVYPVQRYCRCQLSRPADCNRDAHRKSRHVHLRDRHWFQRRPGVSEADCQRSQQFDLRSNSTSGNGCVCHQLPFVAMHHSTAAGFPDDRFSNSSPPGAIIPSVTEIFRACSYCASPTCVIAGTRATWSCRSWSCRLCGRSWWCAAGNGRAGRGWLRGTDGGY